MEVAAPGQRGTSGTVRPRQIRADVRRNRERLLAAARDVFVEQGVDAPLEDVARRAGVGIATLYRRFPDRHTLMRGVALDVLGRVALEARAALAAEPDAFRALSRYLHRCLDLRIAAVMPVLAGQPALAEDRERGLAALAENRELERARDELAPLYEGMVAAAQRDGLLRADVAPGDIGLMVIRLARPLAGWFPRSLDDSLAHRHLDLLLDGLRAGRPDATPPPAWEPPTNRRRSPR
jgi:AcrR family transcriptional regulator